MAMCSYVERRRQRYYFRARLPLEAAAVLGRTHVVGSLMTSDSRLAKIRAAKIYLDYAACLHIIALKMRDALNSLNCRSAREEALVSAAFELGREFEQEKQALETKLQSLKKEFDEKLKNLFLNKQSNWIHTHDVRVSEFAAEHIVSKSQEYISTNETPSGRIIEVEPSVKPASPAWHELREAFLADKP